MKYKVKVEIFINILILSILNAVILSKVILHGYNINLMHCIVAAFIFGLLYYISFLRIYSKYNLIKETNELLIKELKIDKLTGLFNRRAFNEDIKNIADCEKYAMVFIDIDNFRNFNNEYGHHVGDEVLRDVSKAIKNSVRKNDRTYRYGGEEIVIILKDCDKEKAFIVAEKIRNNVSSIDNSPFLKITISLGVSAHPIDGENIEEVIQACDKALLNAKKNGKNKTVIFNSDIA
ncbi:GGDEF domain-containing protein [Clostridium chromiireducens]|uniref:GGDEF domain-containing protein n=1 Tax=Clostridium chromiireducens TaxID=225345 RepID=A0A399IHJ8_9CLOT|nr:GGDEF domain-containing protein [Clostridium chromiireducens]RII31847.1 GGDEF domain-containing protein [Clostridium chromiireducens]